MSNILTSHLRIYRKDRLHFTEEEIEKIFHLAVRAYGEFGSYWVRILKKYRESEKCLDIQYGSAKSQQAYYLLERYEIFADYHVWERISDEGGFNDTIHRLVEVAYNESCYIGFSEVLPCLYQFNKVKITCATLPQYFEKFNPIKQSSTEFDILLTGSYHACNSRSFKDLVEGSEFYGPSLGYDPFYQSDYFDPTHDNGVTNSDNQLVKDVFVYPYAKLDQDIKVAIFYNDRLVQSVERKDGEVVCLSADYWDNCCDKAYLEFLKELK